MDVQDHVAGRVANSRVRMRGSIIEQPQGFVICVVSALGLGCSNGTEGDEHGDIDSDCILGESPEDLLTKGGQSLVEAWGSCQDCLRTGLWHHRRAASRHGGHLVGVCGGDAGTCAVLR